jgi:hypothetical protein
LFAVAAAAVHVRVAFFAVVTVFAAVDPLVFVRPQLCEASLISYKQYNKKQTQKTY